MYIVTYILLFIVLGFIIYQDHQYRSIHMSLPIILFITCCVINKDNEWIVKLISNSIFSLISVLGVVFYYSIKNKKFSNPINKSIGIGDVLFFISVSPFFSLHSYIVFFISGMFFSIILYFITLRNSKLNNTIPLAGFLSIHLLLFITLNGYTSIDLLNLNYLL